MTATIGWLGGTSMELRLGSFRLLTDPVLARCVAPPALDGLDALLLSRGQADRFDATARERMPREQWGLVPPADVRQLEGWGFEVVEGSTWGEEHHIERGGEILRLVVLPTRAAHAPETAAAPADANGYLIEHETARRTLRIAWTGDAAWFDALPEAVRGRGLVDVLIPHLGAAGRDAGAEGGSMDVEEVARLVGAVEPQRVLPLPVPAGAPDGAPVTALAERLAGGRFAGALRVVQPGEVVRIE